MGWLVLSVLGVLLVVQLVALVKIRAHKPTPSRVAVDVHSAASPDDSGLGF
jgi:hypothetical protein